jgi:hypothetical protein
MPDDKPQRFSIPLISRVNRARSPRASPTPMVIQGSQASRAPAASEDMGRRVFELDPAMLILMGLPCVASAASAGADRGGEERDTRAAIVTTCRVISILAAGDYGRQGTRRAPRFGQ